MARLTTADLLPDKATTERNARTLRELVKQPDNKSCADCRKNGALVNASAKPAGGLLTDVSLLQMLDGPLGTCEHSRLW